MIVDQAFILAPSAFYTGMCLFYNAELLHLFEPWHLYELCFYMDKYSS